MIQLNSVSFKINKQDSLYELNIQEKSVYPNESTTIEHSISGLSLDQLRNLRDSLSDFLWNKYNEGF
jgi:hypothetical protein